MKEIKWVVISVLLVALAVYLAWSLFIAESERKRTLEEAVLQEIESPAAILREQASGEMGVRLFFHNPSVLPGREGFLRGEERTVLRVESPELVGRQILQEFFKGPRFEESEIAALPGFSLVNSYFRLRQFYLLGDGTAIVDLLKTSSPPGGALFELALIESISRSLRENVPEIEAVRFLVDGVEPETLGGHVSMSGAFR